MVKRYNPAIGFLHMTATMACDNHGDWVDYLDYSKLHDANAKLTAELSDMTNEFEHAQDLSIRLGEGLSRTANALKGPPA